MKEMVGGCCVCSDERGWPDNPLVYCDGNGCTVAVHQACYGIVTVPTGPWYCRKCESPETKGKVRCELCPSKSGALKRTDTGGWAHVVCALYIPEVRFGNVTSMEPIVLRLIPPERYNKTCYICQDQGKTHRATAGACMQCNKSGCKQQFHVTCAQGLGLLCEEAGNYLDNVKYCGYCQHHYSKLKKGGNVKTIPPYKPVSHDSQSSDSSGEKEGDASPLASGSGTPTHATKAKGPGRKATHAGAGKSTPSAAKPPTGPAQPMDKKKPSPSRRGSSTGEAGGSKAATPAPSPQHASDAGGAGAPQLTPGKATAATTPGGKVSAAATSPGKPAELVGVISSMASTTAATITMVPTSAAVSMSVVQVPPPKSTYQESVITNTEAMDTKQTKKRKAVNAANSMNQPFDYAATPPPHGVNDTSSQSSSAVWDAHSSKDAQMDNGDNKVFKKAKTECSDCAPPTSHFASVSAAPPLPPPPPAHSPAQQPSPRLLASPMPGPSGLGQVSNIRSPAHLPTIQGGKGERDGPASLLVSVPLPAAAHGLNLSVSAHAQISAPSEMPGPSPHIFHQPQKHAAMEPMAGHPHGAGRAWAGLNVSYEMQQDPTKPSGSGTSKDISTSPMAPMPPAIRNKKRAAMAASVVSMAAHPSTIQSGAAQSMANVRRPPQPTPPPIYQETIKDSPPSSPSSERPLKPKMEPKLGGAGAGGASGYTAPHMLGNELNPESGAAACLQEQLTAELAAHAAGVAAAEAIVPPPLFNKAGSSSSGSARGSSAQSLDQLLERQWEQGSQFLMEQAQHFDIASLLSCLHQLRTENVRLEEHVGNLLQRRDHLLAVNARLAIPLSAEIDQSKPYNANAVSCAMGGLAEMRCPRENGTPRAPPPPTPAPPARAPETITSERAHQVRGPAQMLMQQMQQKPS